jgi:regulator of protease activity HflC (stomatin/prohibitin superfamily)
MIKSFLYKNTDGDTRVNWVKLIEYSIVTIVVLILFFGSFAFVPAGSVGVVTRFGAVNRVVYPGMVLKFPIAEGVIPMDTQTQKDQVEASAASKDLQIVSSTIAVNYHLEGSQAVVVYQNIGVDYQDRVVSPLIQEVFKATTSKYTAEQLITERELIRQQAEDTLTSKLKPYNVIVDNFNIVNFAFSPDFSQAIEQKQVAQQNLERAKIEAETAVTQAQGQANAQKVLKDNGSLTAEYLQFLAVQKWDGQLPKATSGTPFLNIPSQ